MELSENLKGGIKKEKVNTMRHKKFADVEKSGITLEKSKKNVLEKKENKLQQWKFEGKIIRKKTEKESNKKLCIEKIIEKKKKKMEKKDKIIRSSCKLKSWECGKRKRGAEREYVFLRPCL